MTECPKCKSDEGYYEQMVVSFTQEIDFDGEPIDASEFQRVRGGKRKYCLNCNKDITKHFPKE